MYERNQAALHAGQVPGFNDIEKFYGDNIHLNAVGRYMLSVTFRRDDVQRQSHRPAVRRHGHHRSRRRLADPGRRVGVAQHARTERRAEPATATSFDAIVLVNAAAAPMI